MKTHRKSYGPSPARKSYSPKRGLRRPSLAPTRVVRILAAINHHREVADFVAHSD